MNNPTEEREQIEGVYYRALDGLSERRAFRDLDGEQALAMYKGIVERYFSEMFQVYQERIESTSTWAVCAESHWRAVIGPLLQEFLCSKVDEAIADLELSEESKISVSQEIVKLCQRRTAELELRWNEGDLSGGCFDKHRKQREARDLASCVGAFLESFRPKPVTSKNDQGIGSASILSVSAEITNARDERVPQTRQLDSDHEERKKERRLLVARARDWYQKVRGERLTAEMIVARLQPAQKSTTEFFRWQRDNPKTRAGTDRKVRKALANLTEELNAESGKRQ